MARCVDARPREDVFLPAVGNRGPPRAMLRCAQPVADDRLASLVREQITALVVQMRKQPQVDTLLTFGRWRVSGRLHPRVHVHAWLADAVTEAVPHQLILVGVVRALPALVERRPLPLARANHARCRRVITAVLRRRTSRAKHVASSGHGLTARSCSSASSARWYSRSRPLSA